MKIQILLILIVTFLVGCDVPPPNLVDVKIINIHYVGDKNLGCSDADHHNYMIVENINTHERKIYYNILGMTNEVIKINWNFTHYN